MNIGQENVVLFPNQEVGKDFLINGLHQILVKMPDGEEWGDTGDRTVTLEYLSPHSGEKSWRTVKNPKTREIEVCWDDEGFLEFRGSQGILYKLRTTLKGCHATIHPVRTWVSGRPGR